MYDLARKYRGTVVTYTFNVSHFSVIQNDRNLVAAKLVVFTVHSFPFH